MRRIARPLLVAALILGPIAGLALTTGANEVRRAPPLPERVLVPPRATVTSLKGRPAIIHFWASWCCPCKDEAPELARLAGRLGDEGTLVGVDWFRQPLASRGLPATPPVALPGARGLRWEGRRSLRRRRAAEHLHPRQQRAYREAAGRVADVRRPA